jgi:uncharacterized protein (TIGR03435 family)
LAVHRPIGSMRVAILLAAGCVFGQEFDVASVKPSTPQEHDITLATYPGGRIIIRNFTLKQLMEHAYGVESFQIIGGPSWIDRDRYSIEAKPPPSSESSRLSPASPKSPPPPEELRMLQALLTARFQLKFHREMKDAAILALVVSGKGPKLSPPKNRDDRPLVRLGFDDDVNGARLPFIEGINATMPLLAQRVGQVLRRAVRDESGLAGNFDFKFNYEDDETHSSLFTAIQPLGLKLEGRKAPVEHLVVDRAERPEGN